MKKCAGGAMLLLVLIAGMHLFGISAEAKYRKTCQYPYEKCSHGCYKHKHNSSGKSSSKKKTAGYDSFYEDDFESYYDENKEYYDDEDDAYEAWEEIYGD